MTGIEKLLIDRYLPNRRISRGMGWRAHQAGYVFLCLYSPIILSLQPNHPPFITSISKGDMLIIRGTSERSRRSNDGSSSCSPEYLSHGFPTPSKTRLERCPLIPFWIIDEVDLNGCARREDIVMYVYKRYRCL